MTDGTRAPARPDASMSLLVDLMTRDALDEGYALAAARRRETGQEQSRGQRTDQPAAGRFAAGRVSTPAAAVLAAVGVLLAVAVTQLREGRPDVLQAGDALRAQIAGRNAQVGSDARQVDQLRADIARARDAELGADLAARLRTYEQAAGLVAVNGPGLEVTLDDAPGTTAGPFGAEDRSTGGGRVLDRDLQRVVNALWAAGAEAIAVSGHRLTATSAIRSAGEAVLVDYRPLSPPYVVSAIGDPRALEPDFVDSAAGRALQTLHSAVGLRFKVRTARELRLPAASGAVSLRYARAGAAS